VVTSNGITIYGSNFPPTVSTHCQYQHIAIPKPYQQYEVPTIPALVISKVLLQQSTNIAAFDHKYSEILSDSSPGVPKYNNHHGSKFELVNIVVIYSSLDQAPAYSVHTIKYSTLFYHLMPTDHIMRLSIALKKCIKLSRVSSICRFQVSI
jgi:hypothetical protein